MKHFSETVYYGWCYVRVQGEMASVNLCHDSEDGVVWNRGVGAYAVVAPGLDCVFRESIYTVDYCLIVGASEEDDVAWFYFLYVDGMDFDCVSA